MLTIVYEPREDSVQTKVFKTRFNEASLLHREEAGRRQKLREPKAQ
jgi:hypothetical protein